MYAIKMILNSLIACKTTKLSISPPCLYSQFALVYEIPKEPFGGT
jgi:hypothetical protein